MSEPLNETAALAAVLGKSPADDSLTVKEETVISEPLTIDQISRIMLCVDRLAQRGIMAIDTSLLIPDSGPGKSDAPKFSYTQLALRGGQDFQEILAIATNQTPEFIGSLNLLDVAKVAGLVWRVQKDFFVQNQTDILLALGLEESAVQGIKELCGSMKSLLTSLSAASPTSDASPSPSSALSAIQSRETSVTKSPDSPSE